MSGGGRAVTPPVRRRCQCGRCLWTHAYFLGLNQGQASDRSSFTGTRCVASVFPHSPGGYLLMCAAKQGWLLVVMVLIVFGADPAVRNSLGRTALAWAVRNKHDGIQSVLYAYILQRELSMRGD
ncbi:uncharacterized protein BO72DRAFT_41020 [Aspergillus fijiensis CBS 313.89]|uniref:Ankyrin n=1 Tax=Aspergillus fijiensis CBS 313.89 TaxID=1448319 RepID=A0A8G1RSA8_9EURO|nr:uncharacterized protein BO72DRAFT_41020 [Aspergillus fijiensis CBS 313.89]RAK79297.1 hypothetical protein BO72DRAFT_41020 [Aspergillus fijiensis CBS 313.89]